MFHREAMEVARREGPIYSSQQKLTSEIGRAVAAPWHMASPAPVGIEMPLSVGQMMPASAMFDATQPHIPRRGRGVGWAHPNSSRSSASTLLVTEMFADGNPDEQPL